MNLSGGYLRLARTLVFTSLFSSPLLAQENLLVYEGFEYDVGSSLEHLEGGAGWGGPWLWRVNFDGKGSAVQGGAMIESGNLVYGDLETNGNHVRLSGELGELQLGRALGETISGADGTSTYVSFIAQRVGPEDDPSGDSWAPNVFPRGASVRLWSGGSERLSIGNFSNKTTDEWSLYGSGLEYTPSGVSFSASQHFVVVRIDHHAGSQGDDLQMWIDPDLATGENASSAVIRMLDTRDGDELVNITNLDWISPFAGNASTDGRGNLVRPHAEMLLDELRIGTTWDAVTPVALRWGVFERDGEGYSFTGQFFNWLYIHPSGWNYAYGTGAWFYLPPRWLGQSGSWAHFFAASPGEGTVDPGSEEGTVWHGFAVNADAQVNTGHYLGWLNVAHAPWVYSYAFETWIYLPENLYSETSCFGYVLNLNPKVVPAPGRAVLPVPADGDEHVAVENGEVVLTWNKAQGASSHNVYLGTDYNSVANATPDSPEFVGSTTSTSVALSGEFLSMMPSYWRVDGVNSAGATTGSVWTFRPRQLAFPGAEGYGRFAVGGRHGRVVHVTNLDDSGPGSFRAAIEDETGPRIVVFDVGGLITLESDITVQSDDDHLTIAGQTAPGEGITLRKNKFGISGVSDVIVRFLRIRVGNLADETSDGTGMQGSNHSIYDHVSVSWSIDEAFSSRSARNITLQRTILAEALNEAGHKNYPAGSQHGYAASVGGDIASLHHNLLAHCAGRNWSLAGGVDSTGAYQGRLDITNNVVYNWRSRTTDGGANQVNFVNNYYKAGSSTTRDEFINPQRESVGSGRQDYYVAGNIMDNPDNMVGPDNQDDGVTNPGADWYFDEPFFPSFVTTQSAEEAYKVVLSDVGANQPRSDRHDRRAIRNTLDGSFDYRGSKTNYAGLIDNEADVGAWDDLETDYPMVKRPADFDTDGDGLPNWWEAIVGANPNSQAGDFSELRSDPDGDGYTLMDDYLAWMAAPHYECPASGHVAIDLAELTRGFTASPVFRIESAVGGTAEISNDNDRVAQFVPASTIEGLGSFTFTVTDADGHSMTRTVGIHIVAE